MTIYRDDRQERTGNVKKFVDNPPVVVYNIIRGACTKVYILKRRYRVCRLRQFVHCGFFESSNAFLYFWSKNISYGRKKDEYFSSVTV